LLALSKLIENVAPVLLVSTPNTDALPQRLKSAVSFAAPEGASFCWACCGMPKGMP
jgi:hypothetical protein